MDQKSGLGKKWKRRTRLYKSYEVPARSLVLLSEVMKKSITASTHFPYVLFLHVSLS